MRFISARAWALVVLSAALQLLAFPIAGPLPIWRSTVCWICLAPFLLALLQPDRSGKPLRAKQAFALGYLCGFLWYVGNCYWIYQTMFLYGGLSKPMSLGILILFALYLGLYHALFAVTIAFVRRASTTLQKPLMLAPFLWVAIELARGRITGFPWDLLGYSQIDNLFLTRIAPVAGVMSISFVVAAVNSATVLFFIRQTKRVSLIPKIAVVLAGVIQVSSIKIPITPMGTLRSSAVMMQENLEVGAQGREVKPLSELEELEEFTRASVHPSWQIGPSSWLGTSIGEAGQQQDIIPEVIIWPEAPSHLRSDDPLFRERMNTLARQTEAPLIIGSLGVDFTNSAPRGYYLYDSASLFDAAGTYQGRYDKIHLVPWGEYIPFKRFFAFADKLTEGVGDMDRGSDRKVFATGGHSYGVFVCYESIFGDEVRHFAKNGAEVLVNISDDGWYGDTGAPWQHLNMARMRAIENYRWILRSTNTGITTAIDPYGRVNAQAPRHVRGAFAFPFAFEAAADLTLYTRFGDWFAWLCTLVSLAVLALAARKTPLLQRAAR
jgi:apolipoprotein N-acyltransferase